MDLRRTVRAIAALAVLVTLVACQNSEERAQAHFERALELLEEGDFDRARVEFRNVFDLDGDFREARLVFADALRDRGQINEAYGQFLRVVEQFPDDLEGRVALAEMALAQGNIEEAERHGSAAMEQAPDDPRLVPVMLSINYARAVAEGDEPARRALAEEAETLAAATPEGTFLLQLLLINAAARDGDVETALAAIDTALEIDEDDRVLLDMRLLALAELERRDDVEAHLLTMIDFFPEDPELITTLLRVYLSDGQIDTAADFLRQAADEAGDEDQRNELQATLVQLRLENDGAAAALDEIDDILGEASTRPLLLELLRASIRFDRGEDAAIGDLELLLEQDRPGEEIAQIRVMLARMLRQTDNVVGARAQVEQALEAHGDNVDALKMQSAWLIAEDETDRAIALLRRAVDIRAGDVAALTLMAQAHARNGDRELGMEFLLLAVEASNAAPEPTLRYAEQLIATDRLLAAEEQLIRALRLAPDHPDLLAALGDLYIRMEDWPRAEQVENSLRASGVEALMRRADSMQASRLAAQNRIEEAVGLIEGFASQSGLEDTQAQVAVIRARLANGDVEGALSFAEELVREAPEDLNYRFTLAAVQSALGNLEEAEAGFRSILEADPNLPQVWTSLIRVLNGQGRSEEARTALADGLEANPNGLDLLWAQASFLEQEGDFDGAIAAYERMYELAPDAPVVANNLASLLASYRDDEASLDQAWTVARRLRGLEVPPFQDTYGWIAYRRGDLNAALSHLEPAAAGLPDDPLVQFHLGMTYLALERAEDALAQLTLAVELAGPADGRTQFETARTQIAELEAQLATEAEGSDN